MAPSSAPDNPKYHPRAYKGRSQSLYCPSVKFTAAVAKVQLSFFWLPLSAKLADQQIRTASVLPYGLSHNGTDAGILGVLALDGEAIAGDDFTSASYA